MTGPASRPLPAGAYPGFDVVVRSRVSVDRNVRGARFPHALDADELASLGSRLAAAAKTAGFEVSRVGDLDLWSRSNLAERELYSRPYLLDDVNVAALSPVSRLWLAVNDGNHLSIRTQRPGLDLDGGWNDASDADDAICRAMGNGSWAFDADLGYLMAEAAFCGSGLSASVTLHAPALVISGLAETAFKRAMEAGFIVAGAYSGIAASAGALFDIALPRTWRDPERAALGRLVAAARALAEYERRARDMLLSGSSWDILDVIGRAAGSALGARLVSRDEAADIASGLRLGLACGALEGLGLEAATELWISLGSRMANGDRAADTRTADTRSADTRSAGIQAADGKARDSKQGEPDAARRARALRAATGGLHFTERYGNV